MISPEQQGDAEERGCRRIGVVLGFGGQTQAANTMLSRGAITFASTTWDGIASACVRAFDSMELKDIAKVSKRGCRRRPWHEDRSRPLLRGWPNKPSSWVEAVHCNSSCDLKTYCVEVEGETETIEELQRELEDRAFLKLVVNTSKQPSAPHSHAHEPW